MATLLYTILCASIVISGVHGNSFSQHVVTIKTERGQIYHCVDFYKQAAFNRSLLKTLSSQVTRATLASLQGRNLKVEGVGLPSGGCPFGTVPILHVESNDVVNSQTIPNSDTGCTAVIRTRADDPTKKFLGSDASVTVYKPLVQNGQWSSSRVKLLNGPDSIEAGWMVNPDLFKDKETHLYAKFMAGGNGCINLQCPGFVQVSKDVPLGYIPEKYSTIGGQLYTWDISIDKHADDGNWWLSISHGKYVIGYWPKSLFTALADVANQVEWGGETDNPQLEIPIPEMGDGLKAEYNTKISAFFDHITISDQTSHGVIPSDTEKYINCVAKYHVLDYGDQGERWGRIIFYGGPKMS